MEGNKEMNTLQENEIVVTTQRVKYRHIEYFDNYVVIEQNRTRRRVYKGFYFDDNGEYIYVSTVYSNIFHHKKVIRRFIVNTETKEWRYYHSVVVEKHKPEQKEPVEDNLIDDLIKE
jgi:hypothetical protein